MNPEDKACCEELVESIITADELMKSAELAEIRGSPSISFNSTWRLPSMNSEDKDCCEELVQLVITALDANPNRRKHWHMKTMSHQPLDNYDK